MKYNVLLLFLFFTMVLTSCTTYMSSKPSSVVWDINQENDSMAFVNLKNYSLDFVYDMKYATEDNFLKEVVYPCDECFLRVKTVKALIAANQAFMTRGFRLKLYDCYRPKAIQKKMWKIVPDANYVANPKRGSIHNRGGAVDVTLVDSTGVELDMGTKFDYFGPEAGHLFTEISDTVKANRTLLKAIMLQHNFTSFDSEWWHYNLKNSSKDKLSNKQWRCDD